jgi:hypothetical protein
MKEVMVQVWSKGFKDTIMKQLMFISLLKLDIVMRSRVLYLKKTNFSSCP